MVKKVVVIAVATTVVLVAAAAILLGVFLGMPKPGTPVPGSDSTLFYQMIRICTKFRTARLVEGATLRVSEKPKKKWKYFPETQRASG
jgi:hypothetical protein